MEKTISYLNTKIWYRTIKVLYLLVFAIVLFITIAIIYSSTNFPARQVIDNDKTLITCNYGNKEQFVASENGVYFNESELGTGNYLSDYHRTELQKLCKITQAEKDKKLDAIFNKTDDSPKLFDISPAMKNEGGVVLFIGYSILSILIILISFEVIKRVFYYIALGSLNPKK